MKKLILRKKEHCDSIYNMFDVYVNKCKDIENLQRVTDKRKTGNKYEITTRFDYEKLEIEYCIYNNLNNDRK